MLLIKIKYVDSLLYKPYAQGAWERLHKTIKTSLILKKLENKSNYSLNEQK